MLVAVAASVVLFVAWPGHEAPAQTGSVTVPPPSAGIRQVATAYIRSLNVHDAATARALVVRGSHQASATGAYLSDLSQVRDFHLGRVSHQPYSSEWDVALTWNLAWVDPNEVDKDGPQPWGFSLRRDSRSGRWLIYDEGTG